LADFSQFAFSDGAGISANLLSLAEGQGPRSAIAPQALMQFPHRTHSGEFGWAAGLIPIWQAAAQFPQEVHFPSSQYIFIKAILLNSE